MEEVSMMKRSLTILSLGGALLVTGCGKTSDATKAMLALENGGGNASRAIARQAIRRAYEQTQVARQEVERAVDDYRFTRALNINSSELASRTAIDFNAACSSGTVGSVLTNTCSLTFSGEETAACGSDTYTFKDGTFSATVAIDTTTLSSTKVDVTMDLNSKFKGGGVSDFVTIDCGFDMSLTFDASDPNNISSADFSIGACGGFSCKIDGSAVSCSDMTSSLHDEGTCS
jgi:hypothetical protein